MDGKFLLPEEIEKESMRLIGEELRAQKIRLPVERETVVKRVIHTTADFDYVRNLEFTEDAVQKGTEALRAGAVIVTDTNMARSGISRAGLCRLRGEAVCLMADETVAAAAKQMGTTRAVAAIEKASEVYPNAVFAVGNAPTALLKLTELIYNGLRPALVIAVPVGFVNVVESKRQVFDVCQKTCVPCIAAMGRKGGSNVAAAICNALIYTALDLVDPVQRRKEL